VFHRSPVGGEVGEGEVGVEGLAVLGALGEVDEVGDCEGLPAGGAPRFVAAFPHETRRSGMTRMEVSDVGD
jgi:hypothetical protein